MRKILFAILLALFAGKAFASDVVEVFYETKGDKIVFDFKIKDGWHILGNPHGDIGLPTVVDVAGVEKKSDKWSDVKTFSDDVFVQYGYEKSAQYIFEAKENPKNFSAHISWLACKDDECLPEEIVLYNGYQNNSYLYILALAFLGGVVLNFMPCIFPILSLKAISLIQSSQKPSHIKIESLLYLLGVVCSFVIIATVLMALRIAGQEVGWGFQLQSPIFVGVLIVIFVVIFLMFLDIINMKNPFASRVGRISFNKAKIDSFVTGFFAVLIASPCTAPFMGGAIGYAMTQSHYLYYPVFIVLALGYALPFTLIGFFPKFLHRVMPKSGKWMVVLKKLFAIPVFLTIVWLGWVLNAQVNKDETSDLMWRKYNAEDVLSDVSLKKNVLINFSAKWCIVCLANEKIAFENKSFKKFVKENDVVLYKADWTNKNEMIARELKKYGRSSVPLYVYYKKGKINILPQVLSKKMF